MTVPHVHTISQVAKSCELPSYLMNDQVEWKHQPSELIRSIAFRDLHVDEWADWIASHSGPAGDHYLVEGMATYFPDAPIWPRWGLFVKKDVTLIELARFDKFPENWTIADRDDERTYRGYPLCS